MTRNVRALVADDEPPARRRIVQLLSDVPGVEVESECANGEEAVKRVIQQAPDLLFLDIQMPRLDGFEVVQTLGPDRVPPLIFVTAYDRYALRAFEAHAVDYLLKPYSKERFQEALARALSEVRTRRKGTERRLNALLAQLRDDGKLDDRILVPTASRLDLVKVTEIDWIEAAGNYVVLHVGKTRHLLRETMRGMGERLSALRFARLHRSRWVNLDRIDRVVKRDSGDFDVYLQNGTRLSGSRRFAAGVLARLRS